MTYVNPTLPLKPFLCIHSPQDFFYVIPLMCSKFIIGAKQRETQTSCKLAVQTPVSFKHILSVVSGTCRIAKLQEGPVMRSFARRSRVSCFGLRDWGLIKCVEGCRNHAVVGYVDYLQTSKGLTHNGCGSMVQGIVIKQECNLRQPSEAVLTSSAFWGFLASTHNRVLSASFNPGCLQGHCVGRHPLNPNP